MQPRITRVPNVIAALLYGTDSHRAKFLDVFPHAHSKRIKTLEGRFAAVSAQRAQRMLDHHGRASVEQRQATDFINAEDVTIILLEQCHEHALRIVQSRQGRCSISH